MSEGLGSGGVLPSQLLAQTKKKGWVLSDEPFAKGQVQPASLDLRLGSAAYRLRCSFLPGVADSVKERLAQFEMGEPLSLDHGAVLERGRPYLIPLQESLALPSTVSGRANPKSSTGRLDIFTRLVTDNGEQFDDVRAGYHGELFLEVMSRTFTVFVRAGLTLNQLRLTNGPVKPLSESVLKAVHKKDPLLVLGKHRVRDLPVGGGGLFLSLDLAPSRRGSRRHVGWKAKHNSRLLDLTVIGQHNPDDFWEPVFAESEGGVVLEPEEFYLLISREGVRVPPGYASEMTAFDPTSGELRTHYAGFFDPGFGHSQSGIGSQAALEVRAHDVPFKVEHGQPVCKLVFFAMEAEPRELYGESGSNYQFQTETLSKHFVRTPHRRAVAPTPAKSGTRESAEGMF